MKHVLQDSGLRLTAERAVAAANLLVWSSAKLLPQARASMHRIYGVSLAILTACETRWCSLQMCLASLLRVRGARRCLVVELGSSAPEALLPLNSDGFWSELAACEYIVRPMAHASFVLERDDVTLADASGPVGICTRSWRRPALIRARRACVMTLSVGGTRRSTPCSF